MQLLSVIIRKTQYIDELSEELKNIGIHHGTIIDAKSMTNGLRAWSDDSIIIGGVLRRHKNFEYNEQCKIMLFILEDEQVDKVKAVIRSVIKDMSKPETAIMYTMPIGTVEGLTE